MQFTSLPVGRRAVAALSLDAVVIGASGPAESDELLYVWMGDADGSDPDLLAVFDVDEDGATYGDVVGTVPLDLVESIPHHTEYEMPVGGGPLFLNAHWAERVVPVDYSDPARPTPLGALPPVPPLRFPHDMVELPNGNVLVGCLRSDGPSPVPQDSLIPGGSGGMAEFTRCGTLVRWASAADPGVPEPIRPYSFVRSQGSIRAWSSPRTGWPRIPVQTA